MCVYNRETALVKQDYTSVENSGWFCKQEEVTVKSPSSWHAKTEGILWIIVLFMVIITEFLLELFLSVLVIFTTFKVSLSIFKTSLYFLSFIVSILARRICVQCISLISQLFLLKIIFWNILENNKFW